jgi:purine nucleosidase
VSQGRTKVVAGGRKIQAMDKVDKEAFYSYILQKWKR